MTNIWLKHMYVITEEIYFFVDALRSGLSTPLTTPMKSLTLTPDTPAFAYPKDIMGKPSEPSGPLTDDQIFPANVPK